MKVYKGIIFGVFSTLGNYIGINPWIIRIIAIIYFSKVVTAYFLLGIVFHFLMDEEKEEKKEKRKKKEPKVLGNVITNEFIINPDDKVKERSDGNIMKEE